VISSDGKEHTISGTAIDRFGDGLRGSLLKSGDLEYDAKRRVWNGMIDKRPALIARCAGAADVVASVRFARDRALLVSGVRAADDLLQCFVRWRKAGVWDRIMAAVSQAYDDNVQMIVNKAG
jgi:hypothetical protein